LIKSQTREFGKKRKKRGFFQIFEIRKSPL